MKQSLRVYAAVLRLVRLLPSETRSYYARFARENFATYRDEDDAGAIANLFHRSYQHSCWILTKVLFNLLSIHPSIHPSIRDCIRDCIRDISDQIIPFSLCRSDLSLSLLSVSDSRVLLFLLPVAYLN